MPSRKIDAAAALKLIRAVRPHADPDEGFLQQLEVFHEAAASYRISGRSKPVRLFYMERAVEEVMNGGGTLPPGDMFARHPLTPSESMPNTPFIMPSRHIRCKVCRQELATREHMLDHGQLGPPTSALPSLTPAASCRPSNDHMNGVVEGRPAILAALGGRGLLESLSMSALETEDDAEDNTEGSETDRSAPNGASTVPNPPSRRPSGGDGKHFRPSPLSMDGIRRDLSDALDAATAPAPQPLEASRTAAPPPEATVTKPSPAVPPKQPPPGTQYTSPGDLAAQLSSNSKLAASRAAQRLAMTGLNGANSSKAAQSPPILTNPKYSGYFVEPVRGVRSLALTVMLPFYLVRESSSSTNRWGGWNQCLQGEN
ncbi:hypothetical protein PAXINDRAFT_102262 [Paxillus involutus ATCC 200175]|uniref:protein-tyrosine-phosphatase n=1 Tax=Paxillus involutus ATCC 200175 TaxID=664439 RepID=A0A0C9T0X7_PAXIN|nr:hypothetical protein PAXINDRAFT_102262 [Paxillus involutus ATCC 200175]